jgi:hypothetical protein
MMNYSFLHFFSSLTEKNTLPNNCPQYKKSPWFRWIMSYSNI